MSGTLPAAIGTLTPVLTGGIPTTVGMDGGLSMTIGFPFPVPRRTRRPRHESIPSRHLSIRSTRAYNGLAPFSSITFESGPLPRLRQEQSDVRTINGIDDIAMDRHCGTNKTEGWVLQGWGGWNRHDAVIYLFVEAGAPSQKIFTCLRRKRAHRALYLRN